MASVAANATSPSSAVSQLERRLTQLSLRTFSRSSSSTTSASASLTTIDAFFDPLQQAQTLVHDINDLSIAETDLVACAALLLGKSSFPYNALDYLITGCRSESLRQSLTETRIRICEALSLFVSKAGAGIMKDYASYLRSTCLELLRNEPSAKAKVGCLKPLQAVLALFSLQVQDSADFDPAETSFVLMEQYKYGTQKEGYTATVKGEILMTLGMMCSRCPKTFQGKERGAPKGSQETMGGALRRLCLVALEESVTRDAQPSLQAGALCALKHALVSSPCESGTEVNASTSMESKKIYDAIRKYMTIPQEPRAKTQVPIQALSLLLWHSNLFATHIIADADRLFDELRIFAHSKNIRLQKLGFRTVCAVLKTIAAFLGDEDQRLLLDEEFEDDEEEEGNDIVDIEDNDDDGGAYAPADDDFRSSQAKAFRLGRVGWKVVEFEVKKRVLGIFMKQFSHFLQTQLGPRPSDADARRAMRRDADIAIHGYGLFASAVVSLTNIDRLRSVLMKLFEVSDRLDRDTPPYIMQDSLAVPAEGVEPERDAVKAISSWTNSYSRAAERVGRRIRFLLAFARIASCLPMSILDEEIVMDRFVSMITKEALEYHELSESNKKKFAFAVLTTLRATADKGSCLQTLLSRIIQPLLVISVASQTVHPDTGMVSFDFESFWKRILPTSGAIADGEDENDTSDRDVSVPSVQQTLEETTPDLVVPQYEALLERVNPISLDAVDSATTGQSAAYSTKSKLRLQTQRFAKRHAFDHLMQVVLKVIPKLNLECIVLDDGMGFRNVGYSSSSPLEGEIAKADDNVEFGMDPALTSTALLVHSMNRIVPKALDDLKMLHDLTNLLSVLLPSCATGHLIRWFPLLARVIQEGAETNPLISCWYRLMSLGFQALDKTSNHEVVLDPVTLKRTSYFIETSALRCKQYSDELLASCLSCVLQTPRGQLLNNHLHVLVPCMVAALKLGLSHEKTAKMAIDEFERWIVVIPSSLMVQFYAALLPELGGYLSSFSSSSTGTPLIQTSGATLSSDDIEDNAAEPIEVGDAWAQSISLTIEDESATREALKKRAKKYRSRKSIIETGTKGMPDTKSLALRAAHILGRVGGYNKYVLPPLSRVLEQAKLWDSISRLQISLPLANYVIEVQADKILPRVTHLARFSLQRQTKVAACELLHALLLIMIGTSATSPARYGGDYYLHLYARLLPELLRLAVDVEPVARQLFRPLIGQLARWFARDGDDLDGSGSKSPAMSRERPETSALLDAAVEALGDRSDGSLRELAADTLAIFFRWTFKSAPGSVATARNIDYESGNKRTKFAIGSISSSINVEGLLRRIYSLMRHPDPFKRLGSTLAFNAIYRDFREEFSVVNENVLQLLENAFVSLRLAHCDPLALGTINAASDVLVRVVRIVRHFSLSLLKPDVGRKGFTDLTRAMEWLFGLCRAAEATVRARAQEFFEVLCEQGLSKKLSEWYFEQSQLRASFTANTRSVFATGEQLHGLLMEDVLTTERALNECCAEIDFRWWLVRRNVVTSLESHEIGDTMNIVETVCGRIIRYSQGEYRVNRQKASVDSSKDDNTIFSDSNASWLMNQTSSLALARFLRCSANFVAVIFQGKFQANICDHLLGAMALALLKPSSMGLDADDHEVKVLLPAAMNVLVQADPKKVPKLISTVAKQILDRWPELALSKFDLSKAKLESLSVMRAMIMFDRWGVDLGALDPLFDLDTFTQSIARLPVGSRPQTLRLASSALRLAFQLGWSVNSVVKTVLDVSPVLRFVTSKQTDSSDRANVRPDQSRQVISSQTPVEEGMVRIAKNSVTTAPNSLINVVSPQVNEDATVGFTFFMHFQDEICAKLATASDADAFEAFSTLFETIDRKSVMGSVKSAQAVLVLTKTLERFVNPTPAVINRFVSQAAAIRCILPQLPQFVQDVIASLDALSLVSKMFHTYCNWRSGRGGGEAEMSDDPYKSHAVLTFRILVSTTSNLSFLANVLKLCLPPLLCGGVRDARGENGAFVSGKNTKHPIVPTSLDLECVVLIEKHVVAQYFPLHFSTLEDKKTSSTVIDTYLLVLDALLVVLERTGSIPLLRMLCRTFREGDLSIHSNRIVRSLNALAARLDVSDDELGCLSVMGECVRALCKDSSENVRRSKLILFEHLLVPTMANLSSFGWVYFMTTKSLIIENESTMNFLLNVLKAPLEPEISKQCAFRAFRCFFEYPTQETVFSAQKLSFPENAAGNECTKAISAIAKKILADASQSAVSGKSVSDRSGWGGGPPGGRAVEGDLIKALTPSEAFGNAVYACLVAVVCKTQRELKFYDPLVFMNGCADIWHFLIPTRRDDCTEPLFSSDPNVISSQSRGRCVMLGVLEAPKMEGGDFAGNMIRTPRQAANLTSSQMLRSSLALGGDDEDRFIDDLPASQYQDKILDSQVHGFRQSTSTARRRDSLPNQGVSGVSSFSEGSPGENAGDEAEFLRDECALLNLDAINSLPAMTSFLTALDRVRRKQLISFDRKDQAWVNVVLNALSDRRGAGGDPRQSLNIRLFGLKVVLNRAKLFASLAKVFLGPMLQAALDLEQPYANDPLLSRGLHYLLSDLISTLHFWNKKFPGCLSFQSEDLHNRRLASRFTNMIFRLAATTSNTGTTKALTTSMTTANPIKNSTSSSVAWRLGLLTFLLTIWQGQLDLDRDLLLWLCKLGHDEKDERVRSAKRTGLLIVNQCLKVGGHESVFAPAMLSSETSAWVEAFTDAVIGCVRLPYRPISALASETIARCMNVWKKQHSLQSPKGETMFSWYAAALTKTKGVIDGLLRKGHLEFDRLLEILWTMTQNGVLEILTRELINVVLDTIRSLEGDFLRMAVDIVSHAAAIYPDNDKSSSETKKTIENKLQCEYEQLIEPFELYRAVLPVLSQGRLLTMENAHVDSILAGLELLGRLLRRGGNKKTENFNEELSPSRCLALDNVKNDAWFDLVVRLALEHRSSRVRYSALMLIAWMSERHPDIKNHLDLAQELRCVLLFGLSDDNSRIQAKLFEFWTDAKRLPDRSPADRLSKCISDLVPLGHLVKNPSLRARAENYWASHVAQLLISMARISPEYHDAARSLLFKDPLSTNVTQGPVVNLSLDSQSSSMAPLFLSTTQQWGDNRGGQRTSTNLGGLSSQLLHAVTASQDESVGGGLFVRATQAQLAFAPTQQIQDNIGGLVLAGTPAMSHFRPEEYNTAFAGDFVVPPNPRHGRADIAGVTTTAMSAGTTTGPKKVIVLRKYRKGELPDIQISRKELVEPLIELCGLDNEIARGVLSASFRAILKRTTSSHGTTNTTATTMAKLGSSHDLFLDKHVRPLDYFRKIADGIGILLQKSRSTEAQFVSCLLELSDSLASIAHDVGYSVEIDPSLIGKSSLDSLSLASGITSLEAYLLRNVSTNAKLSSEPSSPLHNDAKKSKTLTAPVEETVQCSNNDNDAAAWRQLFRLYENLNENDVLLGLSERSCSLASTRDAMKLELSGDHIQASQVYADSLAKSGLGEDERTIAWAGRVRSLLALQSWDDAWAETGRYIAEQLRNIDSQENYDDAVADDELRVDDLLLSRPHPFLSFFMQSGLRLGGNACSRVLSLVDRALGKERHREVLESICAVDLVHVELCRSPGPDWGRAQDRSNRSIERFLRDWSSQSPLASTTRGRMIQPLQDLVGFLDFFQARRSLLGKASGGAPMLRSSSTAPTTRLNTRIDILLDQWETNAPSLTLDSFEVWESVYTKRTTCLNLVAREDPFDGDTQFLERVNNYSRQLLASCSEAARTQGMFDVCRSMIKRLQSTFRSSICMVAGSYVDLILVDKREPPPSRVQKLVKSLELLKSNPPLPIHSMMAGTHISGEEEDGLATTACIAALYFKRVALSSAELCLHGYRSMNAAMLMQMSKKKRVDEDALFDGIDPHQCEKDAHDAFERRCSILASTTMSTSSIVQAQADAHFEFGLFGDTLNDRAPAKEYAICAVKNILKAISFGSSTAINMFPKVLKLAVLDDSKGEKESDCASKTFREGVATVPDKCLLKWMEQMLSYVDRSDVVESPLTSLAKSFPQSFVYPFRVAREALEDLGTVKTKTRALLERLNVAMKLPPVVDLFCAALENLNHPELRLKDYLKSMFAMLARSEKPTTPKAEQERLAERANRVWENKILEGVLSPNLDGRVVGKYNERFATTHRAKFLGLVESSGRLTSSIVTVLRGEAEKIRESKIGKANLSDFSGWLDSYVGLDRSKLGELEIPGWRDPWESGVGGEFASSSSGLAPTSVEDHIIRAFESELLVMHSLRKPKRLAIGAADDRRRMFLVKSGEDLRLDERIEQLFGFMNRLMTADFGCSTRNLKLETYRVVPVSLSCGLIEWVPESSPIKMIVEAQYAIHPKNPARPALVELEKWPATKAWHDFFVRYDQDYRKLYLESDVKCNAAYEEIIQLIPSDLLRRHFLGMSAGPDAFLALRKVFAQSLASLSICSYVLGIGDRHLDNFLLGSSGQLIAIDFGYSFGIGVALLPIPETTPFRLSRQFSEFLAPLNTLGLFFHCASKTMSCLRENRTKLLQVMEVFVNEPLMDWVQQASHVAAPPSTGSRGGSSSNSASDDHESQEGWKHLIESRVRIADLKMRGARPSFIMSAELRERANRKMTENCIEAVCRAAGQTDTKTYNVRLHDPLDSPWIANPLSVHDQVQELISIATSGSILVRQFVGSKSWV